MEAPIRSKVFSRSARNDRKRSAKNAPPLRGGREGRWYDERQKTTVVRCFLPLVGASRSEFSHAASRTGRLCHDPRHAGHPGPDANRRGRISSRSNRLSRGERPVRAQGNPRRDGDLRRAGPRPRRAHVREPVLGPARSGLRLPAARGRGRRRYWFQVGEQVVRGVVKKRRRPARNTRRPATRAARPRCWNRSGPTSSRSRWPTSRRTGRSRSTSNTSTRCRSTATATRCGSRWSSVRRYIPGQPLGRPNVGRGWAPDTDEVPDASRITPGHAAARHAQRQRRADHRQARRRHAHPGDPASATNWTSEEKSGTEARDRIEEPDDDRRQGLRRRVSPGRRGHDAGLAGPSRRVGRLLRAGAAAEVEDRDRRTDAPRGDSAAGHERFDERPGHRTIAALRPARARSSSTRRTRSVSSPSATRAQAFNPAGHCPPRRRTSQPASSSSATSTPAAAPQMLPALKTALGDGSGERAGYATWCWSPTPWSATTTRSSAI